MKRIRFLAWFLPLMILLYPKSGVAQTTGTKIDVQDKSAIGSPFLVSGVVQLRESASSNEVRTSINYVVNLKNTSSKTILAFSSELFVAPSLGSPQKFDVSIECFFGPDVIEPGQDEQITERFRGESVESFTPNATRETPRAELTVLFVQFADGSTFGPKPLGRRIMLLRSITWRRLRELERTHDREGEEAFVRDLKERVSPAEVDTFLENLRITQRQKGTQAAFARVRGALWLAEQRDAKLKLGPK